MTTIFTRLRCRYLAAILIAGLAATPVVWAGFQITKSVGSLRIGGLAVSERESPAVAQAAVTSGWKVSAPTVRTWRGEFLSADPEEKSPSVLLVAEKQGYAEWSFEIVEELRPKRYNRDGLVEGEGGVRFRLQATIGKYKGWYVALEPQAESTESTDKKTLQVRSLRLVPNQKDASILTFVETKYEVGHK
jgi:hypothetical protein